MFSTEDLKTAIGATVIARRNAAARLREAGNPRDPFHALPGMEQQFFEAAQSVRSYDLVLNLLEREVKREARKRAGRTAQSAAAFLITAGLIILATLGFAAALLLMRCPVPAVSVTAFIPLAEKLPRLREVLLVPRDQAILLQAHPSGCYGQQPHERQQTAHVAG